jgi:predicted metal-dependent phosphoesterase TrpH/glycosyltransferase involved in cell wall biosynthesis
VPAEPLSIAQISPYPWEVRHEANEFAGGVARELAERGHRVIVAAPSESRTAVRESKRVIREAANRPASLFGSGWKGTRVGGDGPPVLALGTGLPMLSLGPRPRLAPVPLDINRTAETLLSTVALDIVHVHDPFMPSAASTALRHSHSLNVGTFHEPTERALSTQVARPLVEIFFGRLDARNVTSCATESLMERFFPGRWELLEPGASTAEPAWPGGPREDGVVRIAYCAVEERGGVRTFLRALRRLPAASPWEAAILLPDRRELRVANALRGRVHVVRAADASPEALITAADVVCATTGGPYPAPWVVRTALASETVAVCSRIPIYAELTGDGDRGLLFEPGDVITLAGQLERLVGDGRLRSGLAKGGRRASRSWSEVADEVEETYTRLAGRRHDPAGDAEVRRRVARRRTIHVDLHMHTDHSPDCATPPGALLEAAKAAGLGAIAITDHNEVSGAFAAREIAEEIGGIKVIVAEEVKTAEQGEVIGLFLKERIDRGMTMAETIAEIRRQGGLVYVPHPFDRLHSVPDYEHLLEIVEDIDILEVFNPRATLAAFNEEAVRFAEKYRIVPGAGSDSHVAQGLGSVKIRLHDFDGPEEFLEAMRSADIVHKHKNLIYVQALKFLQTSGGRGGLGKR